MTQNAIPMRISLIWKWGRDGGITSPISKFEIDSKSRAVSLRIKDKKIRETSFFCLHCKMTRNAPQTRNSLISEFNRDGRVTSLISLPQIKNKSDSVSLTRKHGEMRNFPFLPHLKDESTRAIDAQFFHLKKKSWYAGHTVNFLFSNWYNIRCNSS